MAGYLPPSELARLLSCAFWPRRPSAVGSRLFRNAAVLAVLEGGSSQVLQVLPCLGTCCFEGGGGGPGRVRFQYCPESIERCENDAAQRQD